jgi:hypothetical protein
MPLQEGTTPVMVLAPQEISSAVSYDWLIPLRHCSRSEDKEYAFGLGHDGN